MAAATQSQHVATSMQPQQMLEDYQHQPQHTQEMFYYDDTPCNLATNEVLSPSPPDGGTCAFPFSQYVSPQQRYPAALNAVDVGFEFYQDEVRSD